MSEGRVRLIAGKLVHQLPNPDYVEVERHRTAPRSIPLPMGEANVVAKHCSEVGIAISGEMAGPSYVTLAMRFAETDFALYQGLDPAAARAFAASLIDAADDCERMERAR